MHTRTRTMLAWSLWLATFGFCAAGLAVTLVMTRPLTTGTLLAGAFDAFVFRLSFATIGLVLTLRRPANPIGWLYAASGLVWSLEVPFTPWVEALVRAGRPLPLAAELSVVAAEFLWAPGIALGITLPFLLVPDGRLRSRRWRVVVATAVAGPALLLAGGSLAPGQLDTVPIGNPFALAGAAATVAEAAGGIGLLLHVVSLPAALVCVVLRFRGSRGLQRQQLRWVAAGAAVGVVGLVAGTVTAVAGLTPVVSNAGWSAVLCVPVAVAVAVLRYRLWDLDRLVSRTVTYALVTALLVLPYLLILPAATRLAAGAGSLAVAVATLAGAAAFSPLRRRVQDRVDRRFNRRRYDAARTVQAFTVHLREQVDLEALSAQLLAVVEETVQPTRASLWLRPLTAPQPKR